ncbi:endonuclease/exonuclease/phosphatase family protein [Actinomycetospora aeridis]|uniref:Endonuclease/exonuclease/phosphatase family protein n=1 Tax=Actinomycetospora aeridis TaxID=3129231 RepID=A0ABU8NBC6_9PSEU
MTFNIRGFTTPVDGRHGWSHRARASVATVLDQAPDVLGVQELQRPALATYRDELPGYGLVLGPAAGPRWRPEHNAILYARDRLEVLGSGGFWLSATPEVPSASWDSRNVRALNWVRFGVRGTDTTFRHVNVHLDHWSDRARVESVALLLHRLAGSAEPTVVTGDFNCPPGSAAHRTLLAQGYADTCVQDEDTFHGFGRLDAAVARRFHRGRLRLDWILASGDWDVGGSWIVRGTGASDHDPVVADLGLSGERRLQCSRGDAGGRR